MTKRDKYEAYIATLPVNLGWKIDADAQDNAFAAAGPATNDNDPRYNIALATAKMMADDPKAFGL